MIIFGTQSKSVNGPALMSSTCPRCGSGGQATSGVIRYFHLFWIPVFPISRRVAVTCNLCRFTRDQHQIPAPLADNVKRMLFTQRTMLPMFSGSIIIAVLTGMMVVETNQHERQTREYLAEPKQGDIYVADFTQLFEAADDQYRYGVMQVQSLKGSQVGVNVSGILYEHAPWNSSKLQREVSRPGYFSGETFVIDRAQLESLGASGAIRSVVRGDLSQPTEK